MQTDFFDKEVLRNINTNDYPIINDHKSLHVCVDEEDNNSKIYFEINEQRLNSSEIKALLALNEKNKIFNEADEILLNYIGHKLVSIQTIHKILNDKSLIIDYLRNISIPILYNGSKIEFVKENLSLDIQFSMNKDSEIELNVKEEGRFLFGLDNAYYHLKGKIYLLSKEVPVKFYEQISQNKTKFTIDSFMDLNKTLLDNLKKMHNVNLDSELEKLSNFEIEEKVAPIYAEVGKTNHFISIELKYKVNDEMFAVQDYKYSQTSSWVEKSNVIKITKEGDKLVKYISDLELSDDTFDFMFMNLRVKIQRSSGNPFQVMLPVTSLETVVRRIIPIVEREFPILYKEGSELKLVNEDLKFEIESKLSTKIDLFEFKVKFKIKDQYFDLEFLKNLMLQNRKYVQLKDGTTVNVENIREINKWIEFLSKHEFKKSGEYYKTRSPMALQLDEFIRKSENKSITSNEEYKRIIQELKDKKPVQKVDMPINIDDTLREYQKEGVYWLHFLRKYHFGGILADEMGLGKTIQALTALYIHKDKGTHIIVCPKSLIYNWENEIQKYFPDFKTIIIDGDLEKRKKLILESSKYNIVITSYSMIQKDFECYIENEIIFDYMVLDEAHYVKNIKTLSSKAVRSIPSNHKILLTGTPLENNLEELFGTFELVMPGYLGTKNEFKKEFVNKIERNNSIALDILHSKIRPFILRRTKNQVLKELPRKQEQIVFNEMTNRQTAIYNEVLKRVKLDIEKLVKEQGFEKSRIQILSALLKLRQVCNHPELIDKSFKGEKDISGKYEQFLELLTETVESGKKVLIFSQFTSMLDIFERDLDESKIEYLRLDGSTKDRQEIVERFNEDETVRVFLISLKAGGVGLNLTAANTVFLYDPWWNPMVEQQAIDRAHRIGQKSRVNIYKFITKNSIEEKILKLQKMKGNLFENLVVEESGFIKRLEYDDLMELFD